MVLAYIPAPSRRAPLILPEGRTVANLRSADRLLPSIFYMPVADFVSRILLGRGPVRRNH